ncbi:hypothetical protein D3C76_1486790 [compost metagenome]
MGAITIRLDNVSLSEVKGLNNAEGTFIVHCSFAIGSVELRIHMKCDMLLYIVTRVIQLTGLGLFLYPFYSFLILFSNFRSWAFKLLL